MARYTVRYEHDDAGWWVATVKEVKGVHTQGRSIDAARKRIREALATAVDIADEDEFTESFQMTATLRKEIAEAKKAQKKALAEQVRAARLLRGVAKDLASKMSVRDAGELLNLSHQRVQQLVR